MQTPRHSPTIGMTTARRLQQPQDWKTISSLVPQKPCLFWSDLKNIKLTQIMLRVALDLQRKGLQVYVVSG